MKKFLALLLAMMMVVFTFGAVAEAVDPNTIPDTMTSENGMYEIAMVTDVGQLKDGSFNEGTWNGVKLFAAANNLSYKYYQPANGSQATDDDRVDALKAACEGGAKIVVGPGFMQAGAMTAVAPLYPEVKFVFIDGWDLEMDNIAARLCHREGRLHQDRLHGRRRRHQPCLLPLRLRLCSGRERYCQGNGRAG